MCVDKSEMPKFLEDKFEEAWSLCVKAYRQIGLQFIRVDANENANIEFLFVSRSRGWIGLAVVGQNETCSSNIWCKYLSTYQPSNIVREWSTLIMHELGHNAGLQHSRGGVMNPSIVAGLKPTWKGDPSESILNRYYGGEPIGDVPVPPVDNGTYGRLKLYRGDKMIFDGDVMERAKV